MPTTCLISLIIARWLSCIYKTFFVIMKSLTDGRGSKAYTIDHRSNPLPIFMILSHLGVGMRELCRIRTGKLTEKFNIKKFEVKNMLKFSTSLHHQNEVVTSCLYPPPICSLLKNAIRVWIKLLHHKCTKIHSLIVLEEIKVILKVKNPILWSIMLIAVCSLSLNLYLMLFSATQIAMKSLQRPIS